MLRARQTLSRQLLGFASTSSGSSLRSTFRNGYRLSSGAKSM